MYKPKYSGRLNKEKKIGERAMRNKQNGNEIEETRNVPYQWVKDVKQQTEWIHQV